MPYRPPSFYPPLRSPAWVRLARWLFPWLQRRLWRIARVEVSADDQARLRALQGQRVLVVSNHPSLAEPAVLFDALGNAGFDFYLLAAWDTMAQHGRLLPYVLQRLGAYSVMRARRDRPSLEATLDLICRGERIVLFPEGQTYGLNDILIPFHQGVVQMGFMGLEEMRKRGIEAPLYILPMAVKYAYTQPMGAEIDAALDALERELGIAAGSAALYWRLRVVAEAAIARMEREMAVPEGGADLKTRIERVRAALTDRVAQALGVHLAPGANAFDAVQILANALDDARAAMQKGEEAHPKGTVALDPESLRRAQALWSRLKNFVAVRDGYVRDWPSPERFLDILGRLETEVLGRTTLRGDRRAIVRTGEPIDLREGLETYRSSRRTVVEAWTHRVEGHVAALIDELRDATPPHTEWLDGG